MSTPMEYEHLVCKHTREEVLERAWSALKNARYPGIVTNARVRGALRMFDVTPGIELLDRTGARIQTVSCPRPQRLYPGDKVSFQLNANQKAPKAEGAIIGTSPLSDEEYRDACKLRNSFWMVAQRRCADNRLPAETQMTVFEITFGATRCFGRRFELRCGDEIYWVLIGRGNYEFTNISYHIKLRADFESVSLIRQARLLIKLFEEQTKEPFSLPRAEPLSGTIDLKSIHEDDVTSGWSTVDESALSRLATEVTRQVPNE